MKKILILLLLFSSQIAYSQSTKLDEYVSNSKKIKSVAQQANGGWCILQGSNGYWYKSIPEAAKTKLTALNAKKSEIKKIAFRPDGGWCILEKKSGYWYQGIPQTAINKLSNLNSNNKDIKDIAFGAGDTWCILEGKNGYWYQAIPQKTIDKLNKLHKDGATITDIAFTADNGWCILVGSNGYWYDNIPQAAVDKLKSLNAAKKKVKEISFGPNATYILYDETYWTKPTEVEEVVTYNYAPVIEITSPILTRGFKTIQTEIVKVTGRATDSDGISKVTANDMLLDVDYNGYFSINLPLLHGNNTITVKAYDKKMKLTTKTFTVSRKKEAVVIPDEKRVALILGNSNYSYAASLGANPINDAKDMATTLRKMGFTVIVKINATLTTMNTAIRDFGRQNKDADVALFYFAGHGMQLEKTNYLLPVSANIKDKNDVNFESVSVATVQKIMETSNDKRLNLIILDACRNNPFRTWERGGETGLTGMTPPSGTLIAFSTSPGATASNGNTRNGLYTGELIKQLKLAQRIEDVFINTRVEVEKKSGGQQSPWELARLRGKYYLVK